MSTPKVSIIVPIFNVEKYLRQCLDSIIKQTLADIEVILVDDGSTDSSGAIADEYAANDSRLSVVHQINSGVGKAYNVGLNMAKGEYIGLVESDDWIEPNMYEFLYGIAHDNNLDITSCDHIAFDDKTGLPTGHGCYPFFDAERIFNPQKEPNILYTRPPIWTAIYSKQFLEMNSITFLETPGASYQDTSFSFKTWSLAERAYISKQKLHHYRYGHATQSVRSKDKVFCVCQEFAEIKEYLSNRNPILFSNIKKIINFEMYDVYRWNYNRLDGKNKEDFYQRMTRELSKIIINGDMDYSHLNTKQILKMKLWAQPHSFTLHLAYILLILSRIIIKDQIRGSMRQFSIIFGLIPILKIRIKN